MNIKGIKADHIALKRLSLDGPEGALDASRLKRPARAANGFFHLKRIESQDRIKIENETRVKIECGIGIRIKSLIGIEIQKMKELFVPGFVQIGTVIGRGNRIESETGSRIENGNRIRIESGTEIENGTGVENERGIGIRIKSRTRIGIESVTGLHINIDRHRRQKNHYMSMLTELRTLAIATHKKGQNIVCWAN
ncbi:hypothetical protein EVAR_22830_1 [Eumeta japonica]|uniref:Uncharacterized protein n=1 Tax=Eumeta variegata TaxID=151549 RepID=A0A4C1VE14_EUMVA|nr:hypothetical protein EVAR_22830_1 [Eumeta japonica]